MIYDIDFEIESQLVTNTFVNEDYEMMSNTTIGTYLEDSEGNLDQDTWEEFKRDFDKYLE